MSEPLMSWMTNKIIKGRIDFAPHALLYEIENKRIAKMHQEVGL